MFVPSLTKRIGKKKTYFMAMVGATILSVLFYFLPKDFIWGILCLQVLISICAGIISPLLWSKHLRLSNRTFETWTKKKISDRLHVFRFSILGIMFVPSLTKRIGKKKTYFMAMVGATILSVLFYFLPKDFIWGILCLQVLISICAGIISPLLWSMYADISDYSEWKTGRRATGLIFSLRVLLIFHIIFFHLTDNVK